MTPTSALLLAFLGLCALSTVDAAVPLVTKIVFFNSSYTDANHKAETGDDKYSIELREWNTFGRSYPFGGCSGNMYGFDENCTITALAGDDAGKFWESTDFFLRIRIKSSLMPDKEAVRCIGLDKQSENSVRHYVGSLKVGDHKCAFHHDKFDGSNWAKGQVRQCISCCDDKWENDCDGGYVGSLMPYATKALPL